MKKHIILFFTAILLHFTVIAQTEECGTVLTDEDMAALIAFKSRMARSALAAEDEVYYFPIQHHIVRKSNGTGGLTATQINTFMQELNEAYIYAKIQFYSCYSINYINSDTYYEFSSSQETALTNAYNNNNAINIYYFGTVYSSGVSVCGYSYLPSSTTKNIIAMANSCAINGSTLIHEMGHYFGLLHTHDTRYGKELVDGSNCSTAGDLCCDTPADPGLSASNVNSNCVYTGTAVDPTGRRYNPDTQNYMSYSQKSCRTRFSNEQKNFIYSWSQSSQRRRYLHTTYIKDRTITTNTTASDEVVIIKNVTVKNGGKLTTNSCYNTILEKGFNVEVGGIIQIE